MDTANNSSNTLHFAHQPHSEEGPMTQAHAQGQGHDHHTPVDRPGGATLGASFWVALLLAALFIASVNFIGVMSAGHGEEKGTVHETQEATSNQTLKGETGLGKDQPDTTQHRPASANKEQVERENEAAQEHH